MGSSHPMGGHGWAWVDMGGHMSCYGWAWVGMGGHIHAMGGHEWAHVILWVGIGRCIWSWFGYGYNFEGECSALLCTLILHIPPLSTLMLVHTWCEESTPSGHEPTPGLKSHPPKRPDVPIVTDWFNPCSKSNNGKLASIATQWRAALILAPILCTSQQCQRSSHNS